jgi:hypothetical protein
MALPEFDGITLKTELVRRNSSRRSDLTHPGTRGFPPSRFVDWSGWHIVAQHEELVLLGN